MKKSKENKGRGYIWGLIGIIAGALVLGTVFSSSGGESKRNVGNNALVVGKFKEGVDFDVLKTSINSNKTDKFSVTEFFWYGCPHCYKFEPYLQDWQSKNPDTEIQRIHPALSSGWTVHAKTYYTLKEMGKEKIYHSDIMNAINSNRPYYSTPENIATLFEESDKKDFLNIYNTDKIEKEVLNANKISIDSGLSGVPTIVINGKYMTNVGMTGGNENMIDLINSFKRYSLGRN